MDRIINGAESEEPRRGNNTCSSTTRPNTCHNMRNKRYYCVCNYSCPQQACTHVQGHNTRARTCRATTRVPELAGPAGPQRSCTHVHCHNTRACTCWAIPGVPHVQGHNTRARTCRATTRVPACALPQHEVCLVIACSNATYTIGLGALCCAANFNNVKFSPVLQYRGYTIYR